MSRYIDADRFEKWLDIKFSEGLINLKTTENIASVLKYAPTADVKPVVRGEWLESHDLTNSLRCSVCGEKALKHFYSRKLQVPSNFCPHCGADMRGEKK